jgi:hypothetical protein
LLPERTANELRASRAVPTGLSLVGGGLNLELLAIEQHRSQIAIVRL